MEHLYEGTLQRGNEAYYVKQLQLKDVEEVLALQSEVVEALEVKSSLSALSREEYQYILRGKGVMIGAYVENKLIAFRALLIPQLDDEHLGRDIGLQEDELKEVIYQEISNVHPAYRGNRLQKTLAVIIMQVLQQQMSQYRYVCCTVAPFNIPSLKDKFAQGMEIAALKEKYGGKLRYIFVKKLDAATQEYRNELVSIPMEDIERQQQMIAQGFRGIQMEKRDEAYWVKYVK
ncbi:hypothetical protein [Pontibacillus litoralis]|uniref:Benzoate transporter n=1 Tax=Pontibacillus litoralis JSM 072002 TaxID=1385512 RepID=A0A0A5HTV8_9BACI|nr:hypothetical protein [Pontibacillus litoralis]KGX87037.1 benzoate transporter [Pontibacillus litoralis JSM 072002]